MQLTHYLGLLHRSLAVMSEAFCAVGAAHGDEPDVRHTCEHLAEQCAEQASSLQPIVARYGEDNYDAPERLHAELFQGTRDDPLGLLRDLHDLYLMASECDISWTLIGQAAQGIRDEELLSVVTRCESQTAIHLAWLRTRMKQAAPQALLVA